MSRKLVLGLGATATAATLLLLLAAACSSSKPASVEGADGGGDEDALGPGPCPVLEFPATCPTPAPSWNGEVKGLIVEYCDQCHGPGGQAVGQVALGTYGDVAANRTKAWEQIETCSMPNVDGSPPPFAYPTPAQRQAMVTWLDVCNAPDN
ncbi:MAG TPA: hypothetical protein VGL81_29930 [Polyangiaceae bacterium]|jgi:hypothetical protein